MPVTLDVYEFGGVAPIGQLVPNVGSFSFDQMPREDGSARLRVKGTTAPELLAEGTYVRVKVDGTDVWAFVPNSKTREALDGGGTAVEMEGLGLRWLLHKGQILQRDTSDCAEPADTRHLGWMSVDYDDSSWSAPVSFGTYLSGPFVTPRPEGWGAPMAEFISISLDPLTARDWGARATITLTEDVDVFLTGAADDEYRTWLDDVEITELATMGNGPFQWRRAQQRPIRLCAGTHTLAFQVRNLERPGLESMNVSWLAFYLAPAGSNGKPRQANQVYQVAHDHTGGTFTLATTFGETTDPIAYNADAATVQAALEANETVQAGNVTVTGSGTEASPWTIEFMGDLAAKQLPLTADFSGLTGGFNANIAETTRGRSAGSVLQTNTVDWVVKDFTSGVPGLTPGKMLRLVLEEWQARGVSVGDHFTLGCTDTHDSAGQPWAVELNIPVPLEADVHRLVVLLEEHGIGVDVAPDLTINAWNTRGADLSATVTIAAHTAGVTQLSSTRDESAVENVLRLRTDEGWTEVVDAASVAARGRSESGLRLDGWPSAAQAEPVTGALLEELATPPRTTSCTITSEAAAVPNRDFSISDVVTCDAITDSGFEAVPMRFVSSTCWLVEKTLHYTVELID